MFAHGETLTAVKELRLVEILREDSRTHRPTGGVVFQLNRAPTPFETSLITQHWDQPPRFSTRHRPGILRVSGDQVTLDGTTIDEVDAHHIETLRLVLNEVNRNATAHRLIN